MRVSFPKASSQRGSCSLNPSVRTVWAVPPSKSYGIPNHRLRSIICRSLFLQAVVSRYSVSRPPATVDTYA